MVLNKQKLVVGLLFPSVHCAQSRPHREGGQRGVRLHLHHQGAGDDEDVHGDQDVNCWNINFVVRFHGEEDVGCLNTNFVISSTRDISGLVQWRRDQSPRAFWVSGASGAKKKIYHIMIMLKD